MLLRKSRRHLHGASNRNGDASFYNTFYKPLSAPRVDPPRPHNLTATSNLARRPPMARLPLRNSADAPDAHNRLQEQLRKVYQGRKNIVKALDGWGFDSRGFITAAAFEEKVREKLGVEPEEAELQDMLRRHCKSPQRIDAKELVALLHGATEGNLFNETIFAPEEESKQRDRKISNLKESVRGWEGCGRAELDCATIDRFLFKVNSAISKMRDITDGTITNSRTAFFSQLGSLADYGEAEKTALKKVEAVVDFEQMRYNIHSHTSVDHLFLDPILRKAHVAKTHPALPVAHEQSFSNKMAKSSTTNFHVLTASEKRAEFDPRTMLHTNQQKTRFGLSKFMQESGEERSVLKENVSPNQKDLVLQSIKSEADLQRARYENKLEKLRTLQKAEGESIARREEHAQQRDRQRLQRIRHEQEAYNYVNFIKKRWE